MPSTADVAGDFLSDIADRLLPAADRAPIRETLKHACGGQLEALAPDGRRASPLTMSGTPLEVSVTGGGGEFTPAVRYVTETGTQETRFAARLDAQSAAVQHLVSRLPNGDETMVGMLRAFVSTLYPDTATIPKRFRSPTWFGVVHHAAAPEHIARLKVYAGLRAVPGALERLRSQWPGFAGLATVPDPEGLFTPTGAALEVDAYGKLNHKIYLKARYMNVGVPMKLVRFFGAPAWEVLSEFVRCGLDPATIHKRRFFVCCAQGAGDPVLGITMMAERSFDLAHIAGELAHRHYGSAFAVDALAQAAESFGATWRYSGVGLSSSGGSGIGKLNVYGTPTWGVHSVETAPGRETQRRTRICSVGPSVAGDGDRTVRGEQDPESTEKILTASIDAACKFLVDRQDVDGHWRDYQLPPGRAESWTTGCVGFAMRSALEVISPDAERTRAIEAAVTALRDSRRSHGWGYHRRTACDADSTSWVMRLLAMCDAGQPPPAEVISRYLTSEGGARTYPLPRRYGSWAEEHDEVTPMAGLALLAVGDEAAVDRIRRRILARHRDHGRWFRFWWRSDAYGTAHNLTFLSETAGIPPQIAAVERVRLTDFVDYATPRIARDAECAVDVAHWLISAVRLGEHEAVRLFSRAMSAAQCADGGWPPSPALLVPGRWDGGSEIFADDRRLFSTAMCVMALVEAVRPDLFTHA